MKNKDNVKVQSGKLYFQFCCIIIILLISGCAHKTAPGGGPLDTIKPQVVSIFPAVDSTGVSINLKNITLRFSEEIEAASVQNIIFISPPTRFEIDWENDQVLNLILNDMLQQDKTYVISVGANVQDLRKNKMSGSFQSAFSTGDSIDSGIIYGNVRLTEPRQVLTILAYPLSGSENEAWYRQAPAYVAQTNENGRFTFSNLKIQAYRLLAIADKDMDYALNPYREYFGIAPAEVRLTDSQPMQGPLNFQLSITDTVKPKLTGLRSISDVQLRLRFNKKILLEYIQSARIKIWPQDSIIVPAALEYNNENPSSIDLYMPLLARADSIFFCLDSLADSLGNKNYLSTEFRVPFINKADTSAARLIKYFPDHKSKNIFEDFPLRFAFNHPVYDTALTGQIKVASTAGNISGYWSKPNPKVWSFTPDHPWTFGDTIKVSLDSLAIQDIWGKSVQVQDSLFTFSVISESELGSISGLSRSVWESDNHIILRLRQLGGKKLVRSSVFIAGSEFHFPWLPEGKYLIDGFWDKNRNGQADTGKLWPYTPAEWIFSHPDTVSVRKRWETAGIILTLPEINGQ